MTKLAFIMAASHSGSTLLAMLLGSHPHSTTIGDTAGTSHRKDPDYQCSCGKKARECPFWWHVKDEMARRGADLDVTDFGTRFEYPESPFINRVLHAEHRGPVLEAIRDAMLWSSAGWRRKSRAVITQNIALLDAVTNITQAHVVVDSSKLPHRLKHLLRIDGLEVKVIHLVRDGRGVAHTYIHDNGWPVHKSAIEWQRGILAAERLLARLDRDLWTQVRYEDLCADPRAELEKLSLFLGLDPDQVNVDFRAADLHVFGNKMRLALDHDVRLDTKWQTELTKSDIATIEQLVGKHLVRYGYDVNGG